MQHGETIGIPHTLSDVMRKSLLSEPVELPIHDPSELCGPDQPFEGTLNQIGRGALGGRAVGLAADSVELWIFALGQRTQARAALKPGHIVLSAALSTARPALHNGIEVTDGELIEFSIPGREYSQILEPGLYLDIRVPTDQARLHGWRQHDGSIRPIPPVLLSELRSVWREITAPGDERDPALIERTRRKVMRQLLALVGRTSAINVVGKDQRRHHRLARRAIERIERSLDDERMTFRSLADSVGVSERLLYDVFASEIGTSPYDFILSRRLNRVRRQLLGQRRVRGAVSKAAASAGFGHLGEMGRLYKRQFGETPRQTLKRRSAA